MAFGEQKIVLNATSGIGEEFGGMDGTYKYRLKIDAPNTLIYPIKAIFSDKKESLNAFSIKIFCQDLNGDSAWNGAEVKMQAKTTVGGDAWADTGDVFDEDELAFRYYK